VNNFQGKPIKANMLFRNFHRFCLARVFPAQEVDHIGAIGRPALH
jgi:hypothetical protein